jgi:trehalose 6-phosphate synthase
VAVTHSLAAGIQRQLGAGIPIIVSNRAPYEPNPDGTWSRGAGGAITGLIALAEATGARWVVNARTAEEKRLVGSGGRSQPVLMGDRSTPVHYVTPNKAQYEMHQAVIANPLLWYHHHHLWDLEAGLTITDRIHKAWIEGYTEVNRQIALQVAALAAGPEAPLVLVQDYHLYLVPAIVRRLVPAVTLQHFVHVPWPGADLWKVLPREMREGIVEGLLGSDIVGFQTALDVSNFLATCHELLGLEVDYDDRSIHVGDRVVHARAYPISIDVEGMATLAASPELRRMERKLRAKRPRHLIARIDRTDPAKNIIRGFLAYEELLRRHPELAGDTQFWAYLQPSRQEVARYRRYVAQIQRTVDRINRDHGRPGWDPIRLQFDSDMITATVVQRNFDVLLVNSIYDGMNLVAKEGAIANRASGVTVMSDTVGAFDELGEQSLAINPLDIGGTAEALYQGLAMPLAERRERLAAARAIVRRHDVNRWISRQLEDLRRLVAVPSRRAS